MSSLSVLSTPQNVHKYLRKASKAVMKSHRFRIPVYDLPIRLRPWFLVFTSLIMIALAFLGFTNFSRSLPLNDKLLHFICFCIATGVFYFIFDVEEDARRIWFWRHSGLIFTAIVCFFFGGVISEFVQSMLPHKEFQFSDVLANLLGSAIGLYVAYHLERYYRRRQEISRLYRPLDSDYVLSESDDEEDATQLLPTYTSAGSSFKPSGASGHASKSTRLGDVWDEREELFGIGDDSDEGESGMGATYVRAAEGGQPPRIIVTPS